MDRDAIERARRRLADARSVDGAREADVERALERARAALEELAERTAQLESTVPERLGAAVQDGLRAEVLPVARHIAEVRGLANQVIRRLERLQADVDADRRARVEDLGLVVDLVTSGWRGVERRLDRLDRVVDRLERGLEERPVAELYRIEDRGRQPGA
jgi:hypothetical protein